MMIALSMTEVMVHKTHLKTKQRLMVSLYDTWVTLENTCVTHEQNLYKTWTTVGKKKKKRWWRAVSNMDHGYKTKKKRWWRAV